ATLAKIKGTTIKKEKRADLDLSTPSSTAAEIVAPLLEMPGKRATAWARPMTKDDRKETPLSVVLALSARYNRVAVMISIRPTIRMAPSKKTSIWSIKKMPIRAAGIMEMTIFRENLVC